MKRKLVKQGINTLMVSLPSKWVKQQHLSKGENVEIQQLGKNILVTGSTELLRQETAIHLITPIESSIRTLVTNTYRTGYDVITVTYATEEQYKILLHIVKTRLIGFEITKHTKQQCVIENVTEPVEQQFESILKKIFFCIQEFFEKTLLCAKKNESFDVEELQERIQRYDNFCRRMISKRKIVFEKSELLWTFLAVLIHAQRELYQLNRNASFPLSHKNTELLLDAHNLFELLKKAYIEKKIDSLGAIHELEKELIYKKGYALLQSRKGKESIATYHLLVCIRELYQANSPLHGFLLP